MSCPSFDTFIWRSFEDEKKVVTSPVRVEIFGVFWFFARVLLNSKSSWPKIRRILGRENPLGRKQKSIPKMISKKVVCLLGETFGRKLKEFYAGEAFQTPATIDVFCGITGTWKVDPVVRIQSTTIQAHRWTISRSSQRTTYREVYEADRGLSLHTTPRKGTVITANGGKLDVMGRAHIQHVENWSIQKRRHTRGSLYCNNKCWTHTTVHVSTFRRCNRERQISIQRSFLSTLLPESVARPPENTCIFLQTVINIFNT